MKKKCLSLLLIISVFIVFFTGCSKETGFSTSDIIRIIEQYGIKETRNIEEVKFNRKPGSGYYVSKNRSEAQNLYTDICDSYSFDSYKTFVVNEIVYGSIVEDITEDLPSSSFIYIVFKNKDDARKFYEGEKEIEDYPGVDKIHEENNGFLYTIYTENNSDGTIETGGLYLQDNKVFLVNCQNAVRDYKTGFANYIIFEIGDIIAGRKTTS